MSIALSLPSPGKLFDSLDELWQGESPALEAPFKAQRSTVTSTHGTLSLYSDRSAEGRPLLLIHGVNAAASSYEMKPLFEAYVGRRPIHALDLPGFGLSGRDDRPYDPARFAGAIGDVLRHVSVEGQPADVIALSLGAEFAARAALEAPDLVRSLVLISPTGLGARRSFLRRLWPGDAARGLLDRPLVGEAMHRLLVSQRSMHHFLAKSFKGEPDRGLLDYGYASAHQPGASHAVRAFLRGALFTPDAFGQLYAQLRQPMLVLYDRDPHTSFERVTELCEQRDSRQAARIRGTRGMPHFERPDETRNRIDIFFQNLGWSRFPLIAWLTSP